MKQSRIILALSAILALAAGIAIAAVGDSMTTPAAPVAPAMPQTTMQTEQCKVVDSTGKGMIKENMADSGPNMAGDANAWINVPMGQCSKINSGDVSGVSQSIKDKLDMTMMPTTPSTGTMTMPSTGTTSGTGTTTTTTTTTTPAPTAPTTTPVGPSGKLKTKSTTNVSKR